ncbi:MAG TPA: T9SS type A sorting domain-containing protein, partial [Chryseolinea sp.]|nr:T9SS type A sorting domain-containing protein [Chryseolinea sp.]
LTAFGNRAAYLFDMLTPEPDTLVGFDIYYPDYGVPSNLIVDFAVYNDIDGLPGIPIYTLPSYSISRNGTKFKKIRFGEPFLVKDKFYIGWKAPVGGAFKIGLDTNNDSGSKLFVNTNGFWLQSTDVVGSVMIRPVFGVGDIITGIPEEELQSQIFPNPNDGNFFVPREFKIIQISNLAGQAVSYSVQEYGENQKVNLSNASAGLYILRLQKNEQLFSSKIVIR